ncbi:histidine--tRNA ligase [Rickettsiales bacterium (ex Bugula neritina AB1)]|nr:histidine--tRNA ligase [Rickettsiales bacterium (ex Bugula neritina AB1)]
MKNNLPVKGFRYQDERKYTLLKFIEEKFINITKLFGIKLIQLPTIEYSELFTNCGENSDIVNKELFFLENSNYCLLPEGTNAFVKYVDNNYGNYGMIIDCFRYNNPQKGRYRQFRQMALEMIGNSHYTQEVNLIVIIENFLQELKINNNNYQLEINCIGNNNDRLRYNEVLKEYFMNSFDNLSYESQQRYKRNAYLRILDSKNDDEILKNIPNIYNYLSEQSKTKYENIKKLLRSLNIKFKENFQLVRGLDYYNDFVFEYTSSLLGAQCSFAGGGRYDNLFLKIKEDNIPALGCGIGLERIGIMLENINFSLEKPKNILILPIEEQNLVYAYTLQNILHKKNINGEVLYSYINLSKRMKKHSNNYDFMILVGDTEEENNSCIIKNLKNHTEINIKINNISNKLFFEEII